jgi:hypothetical protein
MVAGVDDNIINVMNYRCPVIASPRAARVKQPVFLRAAKMGCFVAIAPRNDGEMAIAEMRKKLPRRRDGFLGL